MRYLTILAAALLLVGCSKSEQPDESHDYLSEVRSVNRLELARMTISRMATIDDLDTDSAKGMKEKAAAMIDALKIGSRKAAYSYDTYMRAYVDLSALTPEDVRVDDAARTITLTLPAVQTEIAGRDIAVREEHYRVTGLRSQIDPKERAAMKELMADALRRDVSDNPVFTRRLTEEAQSKATAYFTTLLGRDGYSVTVKFSRQ